MREDARRGALLPRRGVDARDAVYAQLIVRDTLADDMSRCSMMQAQRER